MISTQVLDSSEGCPAARMPVELDIFISGHGWREVGHGLTNDEGRIDTFGVPSAPGIYRMMLDVASYAPDSFFPSVAVTFEVRQPDRHHHMPIVLSRFGYSVFLA
jgi:5-hydroxyisourate hydrolase